MRNSTGRPVVMPVLIGALLAAIASFVSNGGYAHYRFYVHDTVRPYEEEAVKDTVRLFSSSVAGFYATGYVAGLKRFPAENTVKRRIFQDIRNWEESGKVLVLDRDTAIVKNVIFFTPDVAMVQVDETWFGLFQDRITRRPISEKQVNILTVRYYLKKTGGTWIVIEYEVFQRGKLLPPVPVDTVLKW